MAKASREPHRTASASAFQGGRGSAVATVIAGTKGPPARLAPLASSKSAFTALIHASLVSISCNNRADSVSSTGVEGNCSCACKFKWGGQRCDVCAVGRVSSEDTYCDLCDVGYAYDPRPYCSDACTVVSVSCGSADRASAVSKVGGVCVCVCTPKYSGRKCDSCSSGRSGFPECYDDCSDPAVSCQHDAIAVHGYYPYCTCDCRSPFTGRLCTDCIFGFTGENCDECAEGFYYHPLCLDNCTDVNISCAGHATNVTGQNGSCTCSCLSGFAGTRCQVCSEGYGGYPNCVLSCTTSRCSYRSSEVIGTYPDCTCICVTRFAGSTCEKCAEGFDGAKCDSCAPGYIMYPNCVDACTNVTVSCHGNGLSVSGSQPHCNCVCKEGFAGQTCGGCADGYELYPWCTDSCTLPRVSCNESRTDSVSGTPPRCVCHCKTGFGGYRCNGCKYGYVGANCDHCAVGFTEYGASYPNCVDNCSFVDISCNGRAYSVTGSNGNCACYCISRFTGERCDMCATGFQGSSCLECTPGYEDWPVCRQVCTHPSTSCNGNALSVTGSYPDCVCKCKVGFAGATCDICAKGYTGAYCRLCSAGYTGYPFCVEDCTSVAVSCNSRAYAVTNVGGSCLCECFPQWALPRCERCFRSYVGTYCDKCADGYVDYPNCVDNCTNATVSCNGIGLSVNGTNSTCRCTCPLGYTGNRCEFCAVGFSGYPNCREDCTSPDVSCMGRATFSNGTYPNCSCNCTHRFTGYRCSQCAVGYNGSTCERCTSGYAGYPNCIDDCTIVELSCSGHGIRVTKGASPGECLCQCVGNYSTARCNACAPGYSGYPDCRDACLDPLVSCNNVGLSVHKLSNEVCNCTCPTNFAGMRCEKCSAGFRAYPVCYDNCSNVEVSCNNHAKTVSGLYPDCLCTCLPNYAGMVCEQCSSGYSPYPQCYDDCTDALASCNGHALTVNQSQAGCVCNCFFNYAGRLCDKCAAGYGGYPACYDNCTNVTVSCNDLATDVRGPAPNCSCNCVLGYGGDRCTRCAPGFVGQNCSSCAFGYQTNVIPCDSCIDGFEGHPYCRDACESTMVSCNGNAIRVEKSPLNASQCLCHCFRGFIGAQCERCAVGFENYSLCTESCKSIPASCNGNALSVSTIVPGLCNCSCMPHFSGERCDRCDPGYGPYPTCVDNCTLLSVSCYSHASAVSPLPYGGCNCTCLKQYSGSRCTACASGYSNYSLGCFDACVNTTVSCNAHASAVSGFLGICQCECYPGFDGARCSSCASGYSGFPRCIENCSNTNVSCNGHASSVTGAYPNCVCECSTGFSGTRCNRCTSGYVSYPLCYDNCTMTSVSCNSRATTVTAAYSVVPPVCACACIKGFGGPKCDICVDGYSGWPQCVESCSSLRVSCNSHAYSVRGVYPACFCDCYQGYAGTTCDRCTVGYSGYPTCEDDCSVVTVSCGINGTAIVSAPPESECTCACKPRYAGVRCSECADGYHQFPACVDGCTNVTVSCQGHATNVTRNASTGACNCSCQKNFAGPTCGMCARGYGEYPVP